MSDMSRARALMTRALALTQAAISDHHRRSNAHPACPSDGDTQEIVAVAEQLSRALETLVVSLRGEPTNPQP